MRRDGREWDETRTIRIEAGYLKRADGSAYLEWGTPAKVLKSPGKELNKITGFQEEHDVIIRERKKDVVYEVPERLLEKIDWEYEVIGDSFWGNKVVAAVYGPREPLPRHVGNPYRAVLRYRYSMAPFSVWDRKPPRPSRREIEISKVSAEALQEAVFAENFPMTVIDVFAEILDSNAGTRIAAITAASVALADAGIPMRDMVVGVAVGRAFGQIVVDLTKNEEDAPDAVDMPVAVMPRTEEVVLMQMDGRIPRDQWEEMLELAIKKAKEVYKIQKEALKKKYGGDENE